jgi:hypothetical protein
MIRTTLFAALIIAGAGSVARGQQAAIPTPPKTVNPTPQTTTDCRGCTDADNDKKTSVGKYDEKKAGTVRPDVKPDVKPVKKVTPKKHVAKKKVVKKKTTVKPVTSTKSTTTVISKPKMTFKDKPVVGDPIMRKSVQVKKDSTAK